MPSPSQLSPPAPPPSGPPGTRGGWAPVPPAMRRAILAWYDAEGRHLAFRGTSDPYAILVSEAMAQQTQAARAADAWGRFLAQFPSFAALAAATPAAVLRAWRGLGYNRRALALRQVAIEVTERHGGVLPRDVAALERLPGIGPYTARAVVALAFGQRVGAVDTNVRRVLVRSMVGDSSAWEAGVALATPEHPPPAITAREVQALADASVPTERPGDWTHAVMDVGATFCRPRAPRCEPCPARPWCRTAALQPAARERPAAAARRAAEAGSASSRGSRVASPARTREAATPFVATSRWLRGRILDRLRDATDGEWVELGDRIGEHGSEAIQVALAALQREGLAEGHPLQACVARLPLA